MSRAEIKRTALVTRWYALTRGTLPRMAATHRWPIRRDHCFMRVCLDAAIGAPWTDKIARPAVACASDDQLKCAISVAERIAVDPASLPGLNFASVAGRRARRT